MKNIFKILFIIIGLMIMLTMCKSMKFNESDYEELARYSSNTRRKVDEFADLGNPEKYDKDRSILRFTPIVFLGCGVYFVGQSLIRKWTGHDESEYYRSFWKEEPFGGFHPEITDGLGRTAGSDRDDGRGMLGYKTYGKDAKEKQQQMEYEQQYQQQAQQQNQQYNNQESNKNNESETDMSN